MNITFDEASQAVDTFEAMAYFSNIGAPARHLIAESLMRLVNTPDGAPLKNVHGIAINVPPIERLNTFVSAFVRVPGGWPGIGEMEAIYCMLFAPGDGVERPSPTTPGFTYGDHESGTHTPLLPERQQLAIEEPKYEDMTNEEGKAFAAGLSGSLAQLAANSTDGVGE